MARVIFKDVPVHLKSRVGPVSFKRRTMVKHESGNEYLAPVEYSFTFENGFQCDVPKDVWEELRGEWLDRTANLKYSEALLPF